MPTNPIQPDPTHASTSVSSTPSTLDESDKDTSADRVHKPIIPLPNRFRNNNKNAHTEKILEMSSHVKMNIPLLDGIQQVATMLNFLKRCAPKRGKQMSQKKCS